MTPAVSIILPTHNRLPLLREAVESVRAQTTRDWELLVADDGSTDDTVAWLAALQDPRIRALEQGRVGNRAILRNAALQLAAGAWIAFIDSDDRWAPDKLERQLAYHAANPSRRWSYTGRRMIDDDGNEFPEGRFAPWRPQSGWIAERILTHGANISLPSVIVARDLLLEVGGFNVAKRAAEDYDLWMRLAERSECGVIDAPLTDVRRPRSASFQLPEVDLSFADTFGRFARRTPDPALRTLARTRAARHALGAVNRLILQQRWPEARAALGVAFGLRPFMPAVWRAAARVVWRRVSPAR